MNQAPAQTSRNLGLSPMEGVAFFAFAGFFLIGVFSYLAGELAGIIFKFDRPGAPFSSVFSIAAGVATNLGDPAQAWPEQYQDSVPGPILYYLTFFALLIGVVFLGKFLRDFWIGNFRKTDQNVAQWARTKDLRPLIVQQAGIKGRLVLGRSNGKLIATEPRMSVIVLGPTQTGKTTGFAVPAILEWDGPVIAASVKNDLVKDTYKWRRTQGDVWLFDPTRSTGYDYEDVRAGWSPLSQAIEWGGARKVASWLCKANKAAGGGLSDGDFWFSAAEKLMSPYLFAAAVGGKDMGTILRWIDTQEEQEVLSILQRAGVPEAMTAFEANMGRDERTKSSIFTTAETIIDAYNDPLVSESAANPSIFSSELLNGGKNTLYICAPSHEQDRLQAIFTAIVSQMKSAAYELAGKQNKAIDPPLLICIDEAANIAPLSDLDAIASTAAGIGIQLVTIFQDMAQIESRYKDRARTVVNNHRAKVVLSGISDSGTLEYVSKIIGEEEVDQTSTSISAQGERSTTESKQQRTLASGSYLRRMKFGEGIVVYGQLAPAKLVLRPWYKDRVLKHMVEHGSKPGVMGGPAGANSFSLAARITKKEVAKPELYAGQEDTSRFSGVAGNEVTGTSAVDTTKTASADQLVSQHHLTPSELTQGYSSAPEDQTQLSAFDRALAELRSRDATITQEQPTTGPGNPMAVDNPAPAGAFITDVDEKKYVPGVPLIQEEKAPKVSSPSKWKPSSGGVPEDDQTPAGFSSLKPLSSEPVNTEPVQEAITSSSIESVPPAPSSPSTSKWSKSLGPLYSADAVKQTTQSESVVSGSEALPRPAVESDIFAQYEAHEESGAQEDEAGQDSQDPQPQAPNPKPKWK